jgi:hypothetical protein
MLGRNSLRPRRLFDPAKNNMGKEEFKIWIRK